MNEVLSYTCPFCGEEVRVGKPCPGCAKKKVKKVKRSWMQDSSKDGLDLPDEDSDYDDFVAREFGKSPHLKTGLKWYWWALAVALLVALGTGIIWIG